MDHSSNQKSEISNQKFLSSLASSILDAIGNTPLVDLQRAVAAHKLQGRILAKLEYLNPGFSKKDRIALEMIRQAKASGALQPGQTVVELTSGNTGTGLAIVCKSLGHPFIAVMSRGNTPERARMMQALGAAVVLVDQAPGSTPNQVSGRDLALVEEKTRDLVREHRAFRANQFELQSNALAHQRHTAPEIWQQASGQVDAMVDFAGTAGSFTGCVRYFKSVKPDFRGYLLEPAAAAVLAKKTPEEKLPAAGAEVKSPGAGAHKIQGGGYAIPDLPLLDRELVTDYLTVTDEAAAAGARALASEEGIFAGYSAGANFAAACDLLAGRERGRTVVILICDSGLKYLSTELWQEENGR